MERENPNRALFSGASIFIYRMLKYIYLFIWYRCNFILGLKFKKIEFV